MKIHGLGNALFQIDMDILFNVVLILRQLCFIYFSSYFFLFLFSLFLIVLFLENTTVAKKYRTTLADQMKYIILSFFFLKQSCVVVITSYTSKCSIALKNSQRHFFKTICTTPKHLDDIWSISISIQGSRVRASMKWNCFPEYLGSNTGNVNKKISAGLYCVFIIKWRRDGNWFHDYLVGCGLTSMDAMNLTAL